MLAVALVLAFLIESSVEHFVVKPLKRAEKQTWWVSYLALVLGILMSIGFRIDLLASFNIEAITPLIGQIVTGFVIGRGSNFVSDLAGRLSKPTFKFK